MSKRKKMIKIHDYSSYTLFTGDLLNECLWKINQGSQKSILFCSYRSSRSEMFFKVGILKNFAIFTGEHLCWSLFNKVAGLNACNFLKKRLQCKCFPVNIAKFFKTSFSIEQLWSILLRLNLNLSRAVKIHWSFLLYLWSYVNSFVFLLSKKEC